MVKTRIDIETEKLLTLKQAAAGLPGRPNYSTIWRWCLRGCRGIRLESIVLGGITYTSREALQRFAERCTAARDGEIEQTQHPLTPASRRKRVEQAKKQLEAAGI